MKNSNQILIYVIIIISTLITLPVLYYFLISLPNHNKRIEELKLQELEYQKEKDKQELIKVENEKNEKTTEYNNCVAEAIDQKLRDFQKYCTIGYNDCMQSIKKWNDLYGDTFEYDGTSRRRDPSVCNDYQFKNNQCKINPEYIDKIEQDYKTTEETCFNRYLK